MRVYELAKKLDVSSKEILDRCSKQGTDLASHMAMIPEALVSKLEASFAQPAKVKSTEPKEKKAVEKKETKVEKKAASQATEQAPSKAPLARSAKETIKKPEPSSSKPKEASKLSTSSQNAQSPESSTRSTPQKVVMSNTTSPIAPKSKESSAIPPVAAPQNKYPKQNVYDIQADLDELEQEGELVEVLSTRTSDVFSEEAITSSAADQERIAQLLGGKIFKDIPAPQVRKRRRRRRRTSSHGHTQAVAAPVTHIEITGSMPLFEVATMLNKPVGDIIMSLIKRNMVCNRNQILTPDIIKSLAEHYQIEAVIKLASAPEQKATIAAATGVSPEALTGQRRWPIVVVMGHVDHGKTTLLDHIKRMRVAATEHGGITQHIRAWDVDTAHGKIVFLDTPGHEAFSFLRERGSQVTDIAVLVVAADDGVKPQTIEAINHARAAGLPIIVAINKIDKISSSTQLDTVKRQLSQYDLMPEEWGGQTMMMPISAKSGQGVQELLEIVALQAEVLDLYADTTAPAKAFVIESRIDKGLGMVATVICKQGTMRVGDYFVCGSNAGKIRLMLDCHDKRITSAPPSSAVQIVGFDSNTQALGEVVAVVSQADYTKARAVRQAVVESSEKLQARSSLMSLGEQEVSKTLNLVIKTDTRGSKEALAGSFDKLSRLAKEIGYPLQIIHSAIGDITESDVELANDSKAVLLGLHVKIEKNAQLRAKELNVVIQQFNIIYQALDFITQLLEDARKPEIVLTKTGTAVVKKVFDIKGVGVIAGCYMRDGTMTRTSIVSCVRNGKTIGQAKITSLQKEKKSVKEIHAGQECGFMTDTFHDWQEDDVVVCQQETIVPPKAKAARAG